MQARKVPIVVTVLLVMLFAACSDSLGSTGDIGATARQNASAPWSLQRILERGVLRVGTTGDFFMSFIDPETGERDGYDIELTTKLAEDMGVEIEYVSTDWPSLVSGLAAGRYDITTGASFNPGRARTASYTIPIARVGTVAVIRREDFRRFRSWGTMDDPEVRVAIRQGSVFEDHARDITPNATISAVASPATEYQEVLERRADVAITNLFDAASYVRDQESLQIASAEPQNTNFVGILVAQSHHELRAFIDAWIRAQEHSGYIDKLTERWNLAF